MNRQPDMKCQPDSPTAHAAETTDLLIDPYEGDPFHAR